MFWRKQRAAIQRFHPLHQQLIHQRTLSATLRPADCAALLDSLSHHDQHIRRRKWRLPPRTAQVLVPLLKIWSADVAPYGAIGISVDLRGPAGKRGPRHDLQVPPRRGGRPPRIRRIVEWFTVDPWLTTYAQLADGSVLHLAVVDQLRHRKVTKRNPRGKTKTKTKTKSTQRISASRTLSKRAVAQRPASPPPRFISVRVREQKRLRVRAVAKVPMPATGDELDGILLVTTEPFRWTPVAAHRPKGRSS